LALGNWDFGVRVFRTAEKQLESVLNGHSNWVNSVAWHPTSDLLLSSANDGTVRIWDLTTPTALRTYRQADATDMLWSRGNICWSPNGTLLATQSNDLITLRDAVSGKPQLESGEAATIQGDASSWSHDGKYFANKQMGNAILWDEDCRKQVRTKNIGGIQMGTFSPVRDQIVLVDTGEINEAWQLKLWDIESDEIIELGEQRMGQHTVVPVWSPDGSLLATAAAGRIHVIDAHSGRTVHSFDASARNVIAITWSPDGKRLALAGRDQRIVIRDTTTWEQQDVYSGHTYRVVSLSWSPDGNRLASGSVDRTVRVWDTINGQSTIKLQHDSPVTSVQWSSDSRQLASMSDDGVTKIWDASASYERGQTEPVKTHFEAEGITITRQ
jgi:WD40 repeat protein